MFSWVSVRASLRKLAEVGKADCLLGHPFGGVNGWVWLGHPFPKAIINIMTVILEAIFKDGQEL